MKLLSCLNRKPTARRRGAAIVETAFVVIILLTLSLGLIQWGILFNTSIAVTNLSREGARYAAVHYGNGNDDIKFYIESNLPPGIRKEHLTIAISPPEGSPDREKGKSIHVTLDYDMSKKLFLPKQAFGVTFFSGKYRAEGQMMMEG